MTSNEYLEILCQEVIKKEVAKQIKEVKCKEKEEKWNRNVVDFLIEIEWVIQRFNDKYKGWIYENLVYNYIVLKR